MKILSIALATLLSTHVWAGTLPDGSYKGHGLWKSENTQGSYDVATTISGSVIETKFTSPDGSHKEWKFEMTTSAANFFKVKTYGAEIGRGYCLDKAQVCHYEVKVGNLNLEETVTFMNDKLYRFGSKDEGSGRIMWQESMDRE